MYHTGGMYCSVYVMLLFKKKQQLSNSEVCKLYLTRTSKH